MKELLSFGASSNFKRWEMTRVRVRLGPWSGSRVLRPRRNACQLTTASRLLDCRDPESRFSLLDRPRIPKTILSKQVISQVDPISKTLLLFNQSDHTSRCVGSWISVASRVYEYFWANESQTKADHNIPIALAERRHAHTHPLGQDHRDLKFAASCLACVNCKIPRDWSTRGAPRQSRGFHCYQPVSDYYSNIGM